MDQKRDRRGSSRHSIGEGGAGVAIVVEDALGTELASLNLVPRMHVEPEEYRTSCLLWRTRAVHVKDRDAGVHI